MKTKIISIVVMLLMACNVMAQYDFMTLHFNNDSCPSRRFYWPDVTKFTQSKYDKDGVLHDSYQTQEIWIRDSIYSYSLMDIDSITFTKFNKEEAKRNFISAMNSTTRLTHGCKTITEVESVLDKINGSEGVERAWIDGTTLHVTSINGYTIDFYYDLIKPEENDTDDSEPYNIPEYKFYAPAWVQDYSYTGYKPRALFINLLTKDEGFFSRNQKLRELEKAYRECKIETRFIEESRPRISSDDVGREETQVWETTIFEYDKIYYCAHGGYRSGLNFHTINLSYEIGRRLLSEPAFEQEVLDAAYESLDIIRSQYENCTDHDIALGCIETTENNIDYSILSPSITENFFDKYATRDFDKDKDPIVFSGSCHTLDGNDNMAQVFLGRGAKVVLGYHNANHTSLYASKYFYEALLKGKTVKDAFSSIPSSYRIEESDSEEGGILEPRYSNEKYDSNLRLGNTFTKDIDFETARAEFISNKKVTISGVTGILNPSDPDIEYGFKYGILKNDLNKTIKASEHHYSTTEPLGNFSFSAKLDMSEYQNYYYQAYTRYDDSYCYGDIYQIIFYLIKEIYLDPTSATLKVGESLTIKATFNPANPPNKELDWESSDESIATVSHGIVNAKSAGHATITAKATDGSGVTATCEIEVEDDHVEPITLSHTAVTLAPGSTTTVEITSGNGDYTVSVDKPSIAKASVSGTTVMLEGVDNGTAKVTVKDKAGQTADIAVSVWNNLSLSQNLVELIIGGETTVEITSGSGSYEISNSSVNIADATLFGNNITIIAIAAGTTTIIVKDTESGQTENLSVKVNDIPDIGPGEAIDLGLPSGTLWASYNVGATKQEEYGDYYAWGETEIKEIFNEDNYLYRDSDIGINIAGTDYDVAHLKWGGSWQMPSRRQLQELFRCCSSEGTSINGVNGKLLTGPNGNSIFMPFGGQMGWGNSAISRYGDYWSSEKGKGWRALYSSDEMITCATYIGLMVRPVIPGIAEDIPAKAVDLGLPSGTKWASYNVGAYAADDYGGYYSWGETDEKDSYYKSDYKFYDESNQSYLDIGESIIGTEYDVATVRWGSSWHMPTREQIEELINNCTTIYGHTNKGIYGIQFTGPNGNKIFFPAAGYKRESDFYRPNSEGNYWSGDLMKWGSYVADDMCFILDISNKSASGYQTFRYEGISVRPVTNE